MRIFNRFLLLLLLLIIVPPVNLIAGTVGESQKPVFQRQGVKTFIPGFPQKAKGENLKAYSIWGIEGVSFISTVVFWMKSNNEYDTYKNLPYGTSPEEFNEHLSKSELYGNIAIGSGIIFGGVWIYSVVDATLLSKESEEESSAFNLEVIPNHSGFKLSLSKSF